MGVFVIAFLLLVALFSYDAKDLRVNAFPPNKITHNWIGIVGAGMAWTTFTMFGIAAYLVPVLLLGYGRGYFFEALRYLRHRWIWAITLIFSSAGLLDLYGTNFTTIQRNLNTLPGGLVGQIITKLFLNFGTFGATIIFLSLYVFSLYGLTDLRLGAWLREWWLDRKDGLEGLTEDEKALQRRARDLQKQARELEKQLAKEVVDEPTSKSGLGADLQPVPEPTVRDLSLSPARPPKAGKANAATIPQAPDEPKEEVITAQEIAAASTGDVLENSSLTPTVEKTGEAPSGTEGSGRTQCHRSPVPVVVPRLKPPPRKPKPITVASTPTIGNYHLPPLDFLQHPDPNAQAD